MQTKPPLLEQIHEVETPEHVEISYTIAGLGSRFLAALIDAALVVLIQIGVFVVFAALAATVGFGMGNMSGTTAVAVMILVQFAAFWGYYVLFEALGDGRTPGKRARNLRVVHDDGLSITFAGSAIRNVLRLVDMQPVISGAVGLLSIAVSKRGKRLGDYAAGTIVVHERMVVVPGATKVPPVRVHGEQQLSDAEFDVLHIYVDRRFALKPADRQRIARSVADRLRRHLDPADGGDPAALLRLHEREAALRARGVAARSDTGASRERHALVVQGRERWAEFAKLLERVQERRLSRLSEREVSEFAARYRELTADFARLRTAARDHGVDASFYLARMVATAHNLLYRRRAAGIARGVAFVFRDAPEEIRRSAPYVAAAAVLFFLPMLIAGIGVWTDPASASGFVPREMLDRAEMAAMNPSKSYINMPELYRPVMATAIIANNVQVSLAVFAYGITFGIGTSLLLLFNGTMIGGVIGLYGAKGVGRVLLAFVAPHTVFELSAITIAGAAGLMIGAALLFPGESGRRQRLRESGKRAMALMAGVVVLLIMAGLVEGFISPAALPLSLKIGVAVASLIVLVSYLWPWGRSDRAARLDVEVPVDDGRGEAVHRRVDYAGA